MEYHPDFGSWSRILRIVAGPYQLLGLIVLVFMSGFVPTVLYAPIEIKVLTLLAGIVFLLPISLFLLALMRPVLSRREDKMGPDDAGLLGDGELDKHAVCPIYKVQEGKGALTRIIRDSPPTVARLDILSLAGTEIMLGFDFQRKCNELRNTTIRWLHLDPKSKFVDVRAQENPARNADDLRHLILHGVGVRQKTKRDLHLHKMHLHKHDLHAIWRIAIIEDLAYVSYYPLNADSSTVSVYVAKKGNGWLYEAAERYFEAVWQSSTPDESPRSP